MEDSVRSNDTQENKNYTMNIDNFDEIEEPQESVRPLNNEFNK